MGWESLYETAAVIVAGGKGILAADESTGTITKRFDTIGVESTEKNRRAYRNLLFTAEGLEESIGGVILYDETIRQASDDGTPFAMVLAARGVVPGIKVDTGAHDLAGFPGEKVTEGLDGLRGRLEEYYDLGARFAKWRAVITIGDGIPTDACIHANAHALARYASLCQEAGLVHRRARGLDGRRQHDRVRARGHGTHPARPLRRALRAGRPSPRHAAETEHGDLREGLRNAGAGRDDRAPDGAQLQASRAGARPRNRLPVGWPSEVQATENLNAINQLEAPWPSFDFSYWARAPGVRARGAGAARRRTSSLRSAPSSIARG